MSDVASDAVLPQGVGMEGYIAGIERTLLQSALDRSSGVQTKAADLLGISSRSFRHLMKKYEL
jgi:two-component system response regulator PilR (NtrC family)